MFANHKAKVNLVEVYKICLNWRESTNQYYILKQINFHNEMKICENVIILSSNSGYFEAWCKNWVFVLGMGSPLLQKGVGGRVLITRRSKVFPAGKRRILEEI